MTQVVRYWWQPMWPGAAWVTGVKGKSVKVRVPESPGHRLLA